MNKDNVFKSSDFYMSEGDTLRILIIDELGDPVTLDLVSIVSEGEVPGQPVIGDASDITSSSFTANWSFMENTTGYYLDVATDSAFTSMVAGYSNKDVGNVIEYDITGTEPSYPYYFRLRAYNDIGFSINSDIVSVITMPLIANDWFLPSRDALKLMHDELYDYGVGGFNSSIYWSSSEGDFESAWGHQMDTDTQSMIYKSYTYLVRACRSFNSVISRSLRDHGTGGGLIFYKNGNNYIESSLTDQSSACVWSNIDAIVIGTTDTAIGAGQANTTAIIGQGGHITSAAKLCNDLITS
jgi:hypothetical protein